MQIHEALWKVLYVMKCSLRVPSVMLERVIFLLFQVYWACSQFRLLFAVCLVVYLIKHNIDNDVLLAILDPPDTLLCGCYVNLYQTQS